MDTYLENIEMVTGRAKTLSREISDACTLPSTSEEALLKATDMGCKIHDLCVLKKIGEDIDSLPSALGSDELWCTLKKDLSSMCLVINAALSSTHAVVKNKSSFYDDIAMNLFVGISEMLRDWTDDFLDPEFQVDSEDVWDMYMRIVNVVSPFASTTQCIFALHNQKVKNLQLRVTTKKKTRAKKLSPKKTIAKKKPSGSFLVVARA